MKHKQSIVLIAGVIGIVLAALIGKVLIDNKPESTARTNQTETTTSIHEEYPDVPEANVITRETPTSMVQRYEEGTGILFLGFKECPWCQKLLPIINEAAAAEGVKVHYLDIRKARQESTPEYQQIASVLSPYLPLDDAGNPRISVPDVSIVVDGKVVARHEMEDVGEHERTPDTYWTEERSERALSRFKELINTHLESIKKGE